MTDHVKLVGCDLEYAVVTKEGRFIPAGELPITGVKDFPEAYVTGGIEIDCTAVELTFPPAGDEDSWANGILNHLAFARQRYQAWGDLVTKPSVFFDAAVLKKTKFADTMGCRPDMNVWTGLQNPIPVPDPNLRCYGGHVHIEGGTKDTVKACDLTLGMYSTLRDGDLDRKKMYGKAGAYREKPYGIEYRVMSNHWCDDEKEIRNVWRLVQLARSIESKVNEMVDTLGGPAEIQGIINCGQRFKSRNILRSLGFDYERNS